jgi:hypothetical protein
MATPNITFTTPKGIAAYPWLSRPDTKFSEEGDYKVNLILSKEDAKPIIEQINGVFAENVKEETKKNKGKEIKTANPPYMDELNDEGKPTGNIIIKFKSKAAYPPALFDSKGNVMLESNIWAGSTIRVNGSIAPYYTSMIGAGVAIRLRAVQVIQYVEGSANPERFGFVEEEAGFVQEAPKAESTFEEPEAVATPEVEVVPEPVVKKETTADNEGKNDKDISDIVAQWGTKS